MADGDKRGWHSYEGAPGANGCVGGQGKPCNGFTMPGTNRCYWHTHPRNKQKIKYMKRGKELDFIVNESVFNDMTQDRNPITAMLDELSRTQAIVMWLGNRLDRMAKEDPTRFSTIVTREIEEGTKPLPFKSGAVYTNVLRRELVRTEEGMHPLLVWYLREREHLVKVSSILASLGVKMEQIDVSRRQADLIVTAMHHLTHALGHDPSEHDIADLIVEALEVVVTEDTPLR